MRAPDKNYVLLRLDAQGEHPYATVYHEYTHLLCSGAAEWLPLWLNEGLAEFYQNTEIRDKEVVLGEPSPENVLLLRQNRLMPLPILFRVDRVPRTTTKRIGAPFSMPNHGLSLIIYG